MQEKQRIIYKLIDFIVRQKNRCLDWFYKIFLNKYKIKPMGFCPIQAEGKLPNGLFYYFRARWGGWSLTLANTQEECYSLLDNKYLFNYQEDEYERFGKYGAGGMCDYEVIQRFNKAMKKYEESLTEPKNPVE